LKINEIQNKYGEVDDSTNRQNEQGRNNKTARINFYVCPPQKKVRANHCVCPTTHNSADKPVYFFLTTQNSADKPMFLLFLQIDR